MVKKTKQVSLSHYFRYTQIVLHTTMFPTQKIILFTQAKQYIPPL